MRLTAPQLVLSVEGTSCFVVRISRCCSWRPSSPITHSIRYPILARNSDSRQSCVRCVSLRIFLREPFEHRLRSHQVFFRIHTNGVARRVGHIDCNPVFEQPQLL